MCKKISKNFVLEIAFLRPCIGLTFKIYQKMLLFIFTRKRGAKLYKDRFSHNIVRAVANSVDTQNLKCFAIVAKKI
jgi:hypothetical protein